MLALYADDSAYFASSRRTDLAAKKIQRVFDLLPEWLDKWRMAFNVSKTAALLTGSQSILSVAPESGTSPGPEKYSALYDWGAGWYVKNDVIARDFKFETLEEFVKILAPRAFNRTDAGSLAYKPNTKCDDDR
ncbi:hypothetical protein EVAR_72634_1 [Eumeta japonica]|uniref:Reverse transcriptase domain-containing protein n=1 Tax=Eumeta variegata TaxID=151549 RepID=A0A4C1TP91_EUMVA|nr:hypothetical protein EVAR_72634_1 [Eumeta japonica]